MSNLRKTIDSTEVMRIYTYTAKAAKYALAVLGFYRLVLVLRGLRSLISFRKAWGFSLYGAQYSMSSWSLETVVLVVRESDNVLRMLFSSPSRSISLRIVLRVNSLFLPMSCIDFSK